MDDDKVARVVSVYCETAVVEVLRLRVEFLGSADVVGLAPIVEKDDGRGFPERILPVQPIVCEDIAFTDFKIVVVQRRFKSSMSRFGRWVLIASMWPPPASKGHRFRVLRSAPCRLGSPVRPSLQCVRMESGISM